MSINPNTDRRQLLRLMAAGAASSALPLGAMGVARAAGNKRVALVVKNLGNSYFDACRDGANEAAKEIGGMEIIYTAPTKPTREDQIAVLDSLIAQKVDGIIVAADDANALVPFGKKAGAGAASRSCPSTAPSRRAAASFTLRLPRPISSAPSRCR